MLGDGGGGGDDGDEGAGGEAGHEAPIFLLTPCGTPESSFKR